ncbi:MAG TPA: PGPGW domain-containing protein [Acidimicrobiia bacterium]|nr:PGPGW domain-containing protein [Acidimicrobiia bacterium]
MLHRQGKAVDVRTVGQLLVRGTRRAALTLTGFVLVAVGLAGLLLPVLPGWVLIIAGFAVLSREYAWAHSGLALARRHAATSGRKLRSLATRRRGQAADVADLSGEVVIDLRTTPEPEQQASKPR